MMYAPSEDQKTAAYAVGAVFAMVGASALLALAVLGMLAVHVLA